MISKFNEFLYESDLEGKRVRLIKMNDDPNPIAPGTEGTIKYVDGLRQLIVDWDNGRSLSLLPDVDEYIILNEGAETTGMVGSGSAISGYPTGSWVASAGQSVYGGDSASAFGNNSSGAKGMEQEVVCDPLNIFKEPKGKKTRKDKKQRLHNQQGANIDQLHKVGKKVRNENMITSWEEFSKLNEDGEGAGVGGGTGGGSGTGMATLGNTGGMGAIVSAQPSSIPGDVAGSTKGSGDIARPLGPYSKIPGLFRKKNKKDKKSRERNQIGANIDDFYKTKYVQSGSDGNIIQKWQAFTDSKLRTKN